METFKLVSKITAKHLYNRLKGKSEPIERKKPEKQRNTRSRRPSRAQRSTAPATSRAEPELSPFGDSLPFPEANPLDSGYEKMEEVSLEQLLEGRERPATMSGTVPIPVALDEVEELGEEAWSTAIRYPWH